jgi:hypothetical protein
MLTPYYNFLQEVFLKISYTLQTYNSTVADEYI